MFSARRLMVFSVCVKFHENMSSGFKIMEGHEYCVYTKGNNSKNKKTRVTVHVFCTSAYGI